MKEAEEKGGERRGARRSEEVRDRTSLPSPDRSASLTTTLAVDLRLEYERAGKRVRTRGIVRRGKGHCLGSRQV